jgi:hypothetical protein
MSNPGSLHDWAERLPGDGRYTFSRPEAEAATEASPKAVEATLRRLGKRGRIVAPPGGPLASKPTRFSPIQGQSRVGIFRAGGDEEAERLGDA